MAKKRGSKNDRQRDYRETVPVRSVRQVDRYEAPRRAVLDPRDLPGLTINPEIARQLTRPTSRFTSVEFKGPKPGVILNPSPVQARATLAQRALTPASAPINRKGGGVHRVLRPMKASVVAPIKRPDIISRDVTATRSHGPNHSLQAREPNRCKERPDPNKRTRGDGAAKAFVPWCSRRG